MACSECYDGMECQHCWERRIVRERLAARAEVAKLRELLAEARLRLGWYSRDTDLTSLIDAVLKVEA